MALKDDITSRSDGAVLARNYTERLDEFEKLDAVTHRSGKAWQTARAAVEAFDRYPLYYVERDGGGMVTHKGYISEIVVNPNENSEAAQQLREQISEADTYSEYNDELDTTTFLTTDGTQLEQPFHQSELELISTGNSLAENYSRQPAYVIQRPSDFSDFP